MDILQGIRQLKQVVFSTDTCPVCEALMSSDLNSFDLCHCYPQDYVLAQVQSFLRDACSKDLGWGWVGPAQTSCSVKEESTWEASSEGCREVGTR